MNRDSIGDGMPVGAVDAEADARRSGASDDDERPSNVGEGFVLDVDSGRKTDGGVPVGRADAGGPDRAGRRRPARVTAGSGGSPSASGPGTSSLRSVRMAGSGP